MRHSKRTQSWAEYIGVALAESVFIASTVVLSLLVEAVRQVALSAVLAVGVVGHEDTGAAQLARARAAQASDLAATIDLVVLEDSEFDLFALVLDLLGGSVLLLFALLATTTKAQDQVERGLLLDVVVAESATILQLLAGEDEALLIRGNS